MQTILILAACTAALCALVVAIMTIGALYNNRRMKVDNNGDLINKPPQVDTEDWWGN